MWLSLLKDVWSPLILVVGCRVCSTQLVQTIFKFLQLPNSILTCKVTRKRVSEGTAYGLEISVTYTYTGLEKALAWIQRMISKKMKTTEKWKINV